MNNITLDIRQKNINNISLKMVGGKAYSLMLLAKNRIPLPNGFVVTSYAYERFLEENNLIGTLQSIGSAGDNSVTEILTKIQKSIINGRMPAILLTEIETKINKFNYKRYAIRSSANVEDASNDSWAGQFESYLNVPQKEIIKYIKKCWASVFSDRVINYAGGINVLSAIKMAVIVQESIASDVSGVCFTRDPLGLKKNPLSITNNDNILIEAVFGLGELLVQGNIIPDSYEVKRHSNIILEANVNEQKIAYKALKNGGTVLGPIKNTFKQKLSGEEIVKLTKIAQKIEKIYKKGCDIEWCKNDGKISILQARPITTGNNRNA